MTNLPDLQTEAKQELARRILAKRDYLRYLTYISPWFRVSWHHKKLASVLERVESGEIKRLMVFLPPRHSKSEMVTIGFPTWVLGRDKDKSIMVASYSDTLASEFGRQSRNIVDSPDYRRIFDTTLSEDSQSKSTWATNGRGKFNAFGIGGAATGKGADILIIDDPIKNRKEADSFLIRDNISSWYKSTARTRLSPNGAVIIVLTRWHDDDLAGRILADEELRKDWTVISLPALAEEDEENRKEGEALWPDQFNKANLLQTQKEIGSFEWSALYQQNPLNSESQEFKEAYFKPITEAEVKQKQTTCFVTMDTAVKEDEESDFTGIIVNRVDWEQNWYIKGYHKKIDSVKLIEHIFDIWKEEKPDAIGIEETTFIQAVYPFLKLEMEKRKIYPLIYPMKHHGNSKVLRIRALLPRYQAKKIFHIAGECKQLESEQLRFPKGANDDILDALAYQEQIVVPPDPPKSREQEVREEMQTEVDPKTGYLKS